MSASSKSAQYSSLPRTQTSRTLETNSDIEDLERSPVPTLGKEDRQTDAAHIRIFRNMPSFHTIFDGTPELKNGDDRRQPERTERFIGRGHTLHRSESGDNGTLNEDGRRRQRRTSRGEERRGTPHPNPGDDEVSFQDRYSDQQDEIHRWGLMLYSDGHRYILEEQSERPPPQRRDSSNPVHAREPSAGVVVFGHALTGANVGRIPEGVHRVRPLSDGSERGRPPYYVRRNLYPRPEDQWFEDFEGQGFEDEFEHTHRQQGHNDLTELAHGLTELGFSQSGEHPDHRRPRTPSTPRRPFSPPQRHQIDRYEDRTARGGHEDHVRHRSFSDRSPQHHHFHAVYDAALADVLERGPHEVLRTLLPSHSHRPDRRVSPVGRRAEQTRHHLFSEAGAQRLRDNGALVFLERYPVFYDQDHEQSREYFPDNEYPHIPASPRGASTDAINSLPTKQVTDSDKGDDGKASCTICIEEVATGTTVSTMPCGHWFHFECIKRWLEQNGTCPNCRMAYGTESRSSRSDRCH